MPACKCPHRRREKVNTCKWPDDCIPDSCATAAEQDQTTIAVAGRVCMHTWSQALIWSSASSSKCMLTHQACSAAHLRA
eukprot:scaffold115569_cov22-Tisochrysis_lutea.AAC.2